MKIAIACDHGAFEHKEAIKQQLTILGHEVQDFGSYDEGAVDYPDTAYPAARSVAQGENTLGIVLCGTGVGASITANKVRGIRCALVNNNIELARTTREHNNSNVLAMGGRLNTIEEAVAIAIAFIDEPFSNDERHLRRIHKISDIEVKEETGC